TEAVRYLSGVRNKRSAEALVDFLKDPSPTVRANAAAGIYLVCVPAASGDLIKALKDPEPSVRENAASSLRLTQDQNAILPLIEALKDSAPLVRREAASSLHSEFLSERESIPLLKEVAENDPSEEVRRAAKQSMEQIEMSLKRDPFLRPILKPIVLFIVKWTPIPEQCTRD